MWCIKQHEWGSFDKREAEKRTDMITRWLPSTATKEHEEARRRKLLSYFFMWGSARKRVLISERKLLLEKGETRSLFEPLHLEFLRDHFSIKINPDTMYLRATQIPAITEISTLFEYCHIVPQCRNRAGGRPCKVPAHATGGWWRGRWWSQRGSLLAEKTPWSQTSRTASAALHLASLRPHIGCCPPRSDICLMASEGSKRADTLTFTTPLNTEDTLIIMQSSRRSRWAASVRGTMCWMCSYYKKQMISTKLQTCGSYNRLLI